MTRQTLNELRQKHNPQFVDSGQYNPLKIRHTHKEVGVITESEFHNYSPLEIYKQAVPYRNIYIQIAQSCNISFNTNQEQLCDMVALQEAAIVNLCLSTELLLKAVILSITGRKPPKTHKFTVLFGLLPCNCVNIISEYFIQEGLTITVGELMYQLSDTFVRARYSYSYREVNIDGFALTKFNQILDEIYNYYIDDLREWS